MLCELVYFRGRDGKHVNVIDHRAVSRDAAKEGRIHTVVIFSMKNKNGKPQPLLQWKATLLTRRFCVRKNKEGKA